LTRAQPREAAESASCDERSWFRTTDEYDVLAHPEGFTVRSTLHVTQSVIVTRGLFRLDNDALASALSDTPALFVMTPTVERLYGGALRRYVAARMANVDTRLMTLQCSETSKTIEQVLEVCKHASAMRLGRRSRIVGLGGGVCTDICGFAAAVYCRGISHVKIPTTLLGIIDAGLGVKNGVNFVQRKNSIGTFYPPEYSILDPEMLGTLDARQLRSGIAESVKIAITSDAALFEILELHGKPLIENRFTGPPEIVAFVIRSSAHRMLQELASNLYEVATYERAVDFGHTVSPYFESASEYNLLHGEAVALDIAISAVLARRRSLVSKHDAERILRALDGVGLAREWPDIDPDALWRSLQYMEAHRNGRINWVMPAGIGHHTFIEHLDTVRIGDIMNAVEELKQR
jgi:3-dehydroquinate synthase